MQLINFDRSQDIPIVDVLIRGPRSQERVRLVFDSGCGTTQIDTGLIDSIGYSARDATHNITVKGPVGDTAEGYIVKVDSLKLFGHTLSGMEVGVYDFDNFSHYGIDGLLGFDIIKQMHFELDGVAGILKVFDIKTN
jgi:hypothetical protein